MSDNRDYPHGLTPASRDPRVGYYEASVTTAIFAGDIVAINASGRIHSIVTTNGDVNVVGVARDYNAASTTPAVKIGVYDDPNTTFEIQDDGSGGARTSVGASAPLTVTTGDTTTGVSKFELDISGIGTTTNNALKIVDIFPAADNTVGYSYMRWLVRLLRHSYKKEQDGI